MDRGKTPSEVATKLIEHTSRGQFQEAHDLYHEDAEIRVFFQLPQPALLRGGGIRERLESKRVPELRMYNDIETHDLVLTPAADPEVVTAEWTYRSRVGAKKTVVENYNAIVLRVRDGKIVESRDYHNHATREIANGRAEEFIATMRAMVAEIE